MKWHPNDQQLSIPGTVLVATEVGEIVTGHKAAGFWWRSGGDPIRAKVTHWMRLPELPSNHPARSKSTTL